jgi:hypothetical protein
MAEKIYCILCKKPVRASADMVLMSIDGRLFIADHKGQVSPANDQGWFEIGPDCYRKVAKAGPSGLAL